jgi:hypothetical protein
MIRIGVIRGGTGPEYNYSLEAGSEMLSVIAADLQNSHRGVDILVTRDGMWHIRGRVVDAGDVVQQTDVLFPLISAPQHAGIFSLTEFGLPCVAPVAPQFHSFSQSKSIAELFRHPESNSPLAVAGAIARDLPPPWLIRIPGQSLPYKTVKTREELAQVLFNDFAKIIGGTIESLAFGEDIAVLVTDNFRGEQPYAFPPVVLGTYSFSGYMLTKPRLLGGSDAVKVTARAKEIYQALNLKHLTSIHFTRSKNDIHVGAVESNPLLHPLRYMPVALEAVGSKMSEFLKHTIGLVK